MRRADEGYLIEYVRDKEAYVLYAEGRQGVEVEALVLLFRVSCALTQGGWAGMAGARTYACFYFAPFFRHHLLSVETIYAMQASIHMRAYRTL